jgi:TRAP-type C4-dicarboxylate transport system substrate-binding protein
MAFAVNATAWRTLNAAEREIIRAAAEDAARQMPALMRRLSGDAALTALTGQGADIHRLTPAGKDAFRALVQPVYDKWTSVVGIDLERAGEAAANAAR